MTIQHTEKMGRGSPTHYDFFVYPQPFSLANIKWG